MNDPWPPQYMILSDLVSRRAENGETMDFIEAAMPVLVNAPPSPIALTSDVCMRGLEARPIPGIGWGLFTKTEIRPGTIIGWYTGRVMWLDNLSDAEKVYVVGLQSKRGYGISPPLLPMRSANLPMVDINLHPIALVNEPRENEKANASMLSHKWDRFAFKSKDDLPMTDDEIPACALIACSIIRAGTEITWYYGKEYNRKKIYVSGSACKLETSYYSDYYQLVTNKWEGGLIPYAAALLNPPLTRALGKRKSPRGY